MSIPGSFSYFRAHKQFKARREVAVERFKSASEVLKEAKKGDIIEIKTDNMYITHFGIYVGDRNIIHLISVGAYKGEIREEGLEIYAKKNQCRINNLNLEELQMGLTRNSVSKILANVYDKLSKNEGRCGYSVGDENCEHFVTSAVFGKSFSFQADIAVQNNVDEVGNLFCCFQKVGSNCCCNKETTNNFNVNIQS